MANTPAETPERQAFYSRIDRQNLTPLWSVMNNLVTPQPKSGCVPFGWRFTDIREAMLEAGALISAQEAERRVLILENPGLRGQSRITTSLYAGVQLVLPGEVAPAHRHTQSALRFVLEGSGAHTSVNGERTVMQFGDFVITPQMSWHDHGNETDAPMFWLDGLDIPLVSFLDCSFSESLGQEEQIVTRTTGQSWAEFGNNMLPVNADQSGVVSPIFNYPYEQARQSLDVLQKGGDPDLCEGWKLRYSNPLNGGYAMPTMAAFIQLLPKGKTLLRRATDATIYVCTQGSGETTIGDVVIPWSKRDIFVVPSWAPVIHNVFDEAILFSYSDRVVQEKLGLWREQCGTI